MLQPDGHSQRGSSVTAQMLEERINMYISAMDRANAMNDGHQSSQLQRDIQQLVDLMERVSAGQFIPELEVPPPLVITPQIDVLANPLGELSSRLADYHKALYFAEEELSEDKINKIQMLQRGLQTIHGLQKRAQAGFPVRADEIPPPVNIPSDDEFDSDAVNILAERLSQYKAALLSAEQSEGSDKKRIPKIQSALRTIEFLLTRAKANRPVWKRDIPPEFDYYEIGIGGQSGKHLNKAKYNLQLRSLLVRAKNIMLKDKEQQKKVEEVYKKLKRLEERVAQSKLTAQLDSSLSAAMRQVEELEKLAFEEKSRDPARLSEDLALIEQRIQEYKMAALHCKHEEHVNYSIQHLKVVKGLQSLKESLEKRDTVDMTLVPPPPREFTPTSDSPPPFSDQEHNSASTGHTESTSRTTAHLTLVNIQLAIETAEDKLAKTLTMYLDKDDSSVQPTSSEQLSFIRNVNLSSTSALPLLPKVQNSAREASSSNEGISKDTVSVTQEEEEEEALLCENGIDVPKPIDNKEEMKDDSIIAEPEASLNVESVLSVAGARTEKETDITHQELSSVSHLAASTNNNTEQDLVTLEKEYEEKEMQLGNKNGLTSSTSSLAGHTSPMRSTEIYNRKTLDSVGFLSCQNVPEELYLKSKVPNFVPAVTKLQESSSEEPKSDPTENSVNFENHNDRTILETVDSSEKDFTNDGDITEKDTIYPAVTNEESVNETTSKTESSDNEKVHEKEQFYNDAALHEKEDSENSSKGAIIFPNDVSNTTGLSDLVDSENYVLDKSGPSSINLPSQAPEKYFHYADSGPASLPATFVFSDPSQIPNNLSYVPDFASDFKLSGSSGETQIQNCHSDNSSEKGNAGTTDSSNESSHYNHVYDSLDTTHGSMVSQDEPQDGNSSEMLEFKELMESMSMPSVMIAPSAAQKDSPLDSNLQTSHLESLYPGRGTVSPQQIVQSSEGHECHTSSIELVVSIPSQGNQTSKLPSLTAYLPSSYQSFNNNTNAIGATTLSLTASQTSQVFQTENPNLFSESSVATSEVTRNHKVTTETEASDVLRHTITSKIQHVSTGSSDYVASVSNNLQMDSSLTPTKSTSQSWNILSAQPVVLSGPQSIGAAVNGFDHHLSQTSVTFTCLENLKFDILLEMAKATENSKEEARKLKANFDGVKFKLQKGGRQIWDVYKACVEKELTSLTKEIHSLQMAERWNEAKVLSQKKMLAEREMSVLRERLPSLKY